MNNFIEQNRELILILLTSQLTGNISTSLQNTDRNSEKLSVKSIEDRVTGVMHLAPTLLGSTALKTHEQ